MVTYKVNPILTHRETEKQEEKAKLDEVPVLEKRRPKNKKAKTETLSQKVDKANIKNMKDHIYTPAAFFEQQRSLFVRPDTANLTFGDVVRPVGFPTDMESYRINSPDYKNMQYKARQEFDAYGNLVRTVYLENVKYLY
jgi:hypothetical protein